MSQWKNDDSAANSVNWAAVRVNKTPNTTNQTNLFGNVTSGAFISGVAVGQFGVDSTENAVSSGGLIAGQVTFGGSGYAANATVTLAGGGGSSGVANAHANTSTGRIDAVNISTAGSGYSSSPGVTIAAPAAISFNANTQGISGTGNVAINITSANSKFQVGDKVRYLVTAGNTAISPLANNTQYYVVACNTTTIGISSTLNGSPTALTVVVADESGHSVTGETATGAVVVGGAKNKGVTHAGWVLRTVGSGGRAGRVQYETLVAMGSMTGDASDDTVLPDS